MFINKNKYYIYIEKLSSINLNMIKIKNKFNLIYRNNITNERPDKIISFIKRCRIKGVKFFIYNDMSMALKFNAHGVYLSSKNRTMLKKIKQKVRDLKL